MSTKLKSSRTATRKTRRPAAKPGSRRATAAKRVSKSLRSRPAVKTKGTKQSQVIATLRSPAGATIEQLTKLTGWQAHTVRGTISGTLRKRLQLNVICVDHVYRITDAPA